MTQINVSPVAYKNGLALRFRRILGEAWGSLSPQSRYTWLAKAIEFAQDAFKEEAKATDIKLPEKYDDFKMPIKVDVDGDGVLDIAAWVYSPKMLYGTYSKACKNTWNPEAVKQTMELLCDLYKLRDTGEW